MRGSLEPRRCLFMKAASAILGLWLVTRDEIADV